MNLDLTSLEKAIAQLADALDTYHDEITQNSPRHKKHMRSAVIQSFEFTYELTLKMLKRYLGVALLNPAAVTSMNFKDIIREAYKKDLIHSDVSVWDQYRDNRGITSHTYDEEKAQEVFEAASEFLHEAQYVLSSLQKAQSVSSQMSERATKKDLESEITKLQSRLHDLATKLEDTKDVNADSAKKSSKTSRS